ncbi:MAG: MgtC/SapB family protein [Aggregatilineales bacterium]
MNLELQLSLAVNITIAMILSGIIGINRERSNKSAGLRTHMLTGTGACIFTILSLHAFPEADTSRVASNIVTGIGFLGGGIIIQRKNEAFDLTTAAGVWATAAIGMAMGVGAWFIAIYCTVVLWFILAMIKRFKFILGTNTNGVNVIDPEEKPKPQLKKKDLLEPTLSNDAIRTTT